MTKRNQTNFQFYRRLNKLSRKLDEHAQGNTQEHAVKASVEVFYKYMVDNSRVRTGLLKSRWAMEFDPNGLHSRGKITNDTPYAPFMEYGFTTRSGDWWEGDHMSPEARKEAAAEYRRLMRLAIEELKS